jgi:regulator of replication initiation timing
VTAKVFAAKIREFFDELFFSKYNHFLIDEIGYLKAQVLVEQNRNTNLQVTIDLLRLRLDEKDKPAPFVKRDLKTAPDPNPSWQAQQTRRNKLIEEDKDPNVLAPNF